MLPVTIVEKNFSDIPKDLYVDIFLFVDINTIINIKPNIIKNDIFKYLKITKINNKEIQQEFIDGEVFIKFDNLKINPNYIFEKFMHSNSFNDYNISYLIYLKNKCGKNNEIDFSIEDNHAIKHASENGQNEIVKLLLEDKKVDSTADNNYAVINAYRYGCYETVKLLMKHQKIAFFIFNGLTIYINSYGIVGPDTTILLVKDSRDKNNLQNE